MPHSPAATTTSSPTGGTNGEEAPFVKVTPQGQVYLAGYVNKDNAHSIDFDTDSTLTATGFQTLFIAQYDTLGDMKWLRMVQSDTVTNWSYSRTKLQDIDVDAQGNVYALCRFPANSALSGSSLTIPPGSDNGMYVLKYSQAGQLQSVTKMDMTFNNTGANVMNLRRHPQSGNYYINGALVPFTPYDDTLYLGGNRINTMAYLACYNTNGQLLWHKKNTYTAGLNNTRWAEDGIHFDASGNVYIAGQGAHGDGFNGFSFNNPLGATTADVVPFVMKMTATGALTWTSSGYSYPFSVTNKMTLGNNKIAVGGAYGGLLVWGNDTVRNTPTTGQDGWFAVLDMATGAIQHIDQLIGPATYDGVTAVHYHNSDLILGGYFQSNIKAGSNTVFSNGGSSDFFVAKYGYPCGCVAPVATFTKVANKLNFLFTNTTTGILDSLRWYFGDGQTSNTANPAHTYAAAGTYTVSLVTFGACGKDSTMQQVQATLSVQKLSAVFPEVVMYPMPVQEQLFIDKAVQGMQLQCFDITSKLILQQTLQTGKNSISTSVLKPGMYLIKLRHPDGRTASDRMMKL